MLIVLGCGFGLVRFWFCVVADGFGDFGFLLMVLGLVWGCVVLAVGGGRIWFWLDGVYCGFWWLVAGVWVVGLGLGG